MVHGSKTQANFYILSLTEVKENTPQVCYRYTKCKNSIGVKFVYNNLDEKPNKFVETKHLVSIPMAAIKL